MSSEKRVTISGGNWLQGLADALDDEQVAEIVVESRGAKKLAHEYIRDMGIDPKSKRIIVQASDPLAKFYGHRKSGEGE